MPFSTWQQGNKNETKNSLCGKVDNGFFNEMPFALSLLISLATDSFWLDAFMVEMGT